MIDCVAKSPLLPVRKKKQNIVFAWKKQYVYGNLHVRQKLRMQCSLNFEFGTYNVIECIFIFFNKNLHGFSFGNVLLYITSIFNALELINNI